MQFKYIKDTIEIINTFNITISTRFLEQKATSLILFFQQNYFQNYVTLKKMTKYLF